MSNPRKAKWTRFLGVMGVCVLMAPVWYFALAREIPEAAGWSVFFLILLPCLAGSILVGLVFTGLSLCRGKAPSLYFSILVPAIGALGLCSVGWMFSARQEASFLTYSLNDYIFSLFSAYFIVGFITLPLSLIQTWLMRRIMRVELPAQPVEDVGISAGATA